MDAESLLCPITSQRLVDPVVDPEGNTYERSAILDWLRRNPISPITRSPLTPDQLVPNRALASLLAATRPTDAEPPAAPRPPPAESLPLEQLKLQPAVEAPPFELSISAIHNARGTAHIKLGVNSSSHDKTHSASAIICVIDVSYSMDDRATMHGDQEGSAGLSILDIVKHATHTIIETLSPHDMFGLVTYADEGKVVFPVRTMTAENRALAWDRVKNLETEGQTNLWSGLETAMEMCKSIKHPKTTIMLLTDGMPNIDPPRGHRATLARYLQEVQDPKFEISTFGFGYRLASSLLRDIASLGRGSYAFIPDSSFVGTCFVNSAANVLATAIPHAVLEVEALNGMTIAGSLCEIVHTKEDNKMLIELPPMQYGQVKDILVKINVGEVDTSMPMIRATLKHSGTGIVSTESSLLVDGTKDDIDMRDQHARLLLVNFIAETEKKISSEKDSEKRAELFKEAEVGRQKLIDQIDKLCPEAYRTEFCKSLLEDITGQLKEAYSREDWHKKWGCHYLPSLARSHNLQLCTNFKDPGLQGYSGPKFCSIRDTAEDMFIKLPPPTPSLMTSGNAAAPVSMSRFHNVNNPCFAAGNVLMADGSVRDVSQVQAGDVVSSLNGPGRHATVKCVVATRCSRDEAELVELPGGVWVTKYHPVRRAGSELWCFPHELGSASNVPCHWVYSFVLDPPTAAAMYIGGYECVTLGHELLGPVVSHPYYGAALVLEDLAGMVGWEAGRVELQPNPAVRDIQTGLIMGLRQIQYCDEGRKPPVLALPSVQHPCIVEVLSAS